MTSDDPEASHPEKIDDHGEAPPPRRVLVEHAQTSYTHAKHMDNARGHLRLGVLTQETIGRLKEEHGSGPGLLEKVPEPLRYIPWSRHYLSAGLFAQLAVEAFINDLGELRFKELWAQLERLQLKTRLDLLVREFSLSPDWNSRPFITFGELNDLRRKVTHAKKEETAGVVPVYVQPGETPDIPELESELDKLSTRKVAERLVKDAAEICESLAAGAADAGEDVDPVTIWISGRFHGSYTRPAEGA